MKVIISSPANHGVNNHTRGLSTLHLSLINPSKVSANPTEGLTKRLFNPSKLYEISPMCSPCGLTDNASESVSVPASLELKVKRPLVYRECLKNHAAHIGVHATDGCGEFIPGGTVGSLEALTCAACQCHRNFHRRESEDEKASCSDSSLHEAFMDHRWMDTRTCTFPSPLPLPSPSFYSTYMSQGANNTNTKNFSSRCSLMSPCSTASLKKRFRTKFTEEQKERMASFAEANGWRMHKNREGVVEQFCAEIGVKRDRKSVV